jgi:peroxiredoxin
MSERLSRILPFLALVAAAALVVVLAAQKRGLIAKYNDLQVKYRQALTEPRPGMYMPAFQTTTLDGRPTTIGQLPAEGRQVLLVYTTTCRFCRSSLPAWKQLTATLEGLRSPAVDVYGVSLDSVDVTRKYAAEHALPYPTVRFPDERLASMYRAGAVPLTLVLDEEGRTVYSRLGELKAQAAIDSVIAAVKARPQTRPAPGQQQQPQQPDRQAAR